MNPFPIPHLQGRDIDMRALPAPQRMMPMVVHRPAPFDGVVIINVLDDTGSERPLIFRDHIDTLLGNVNHVHYPWWGLDVMVQTGNGIFQRRSIWLQMEWRTPGPAGRSATEGVFWELFHVNYLQRSFEQGCQPLSGMSLRARVFTSTSPYNQGAMAVANSAGGAYALIKVHNHPNF
ncbi:hypothetical protein BJ508DRAFT_90447 [Ascobolus immersus RN42]|uniref:Uncharacterized protein n=1 Tax=Ascobolus immersus RN42 TaxID=1160509 RepID=A0A3N4I869_ASCIM|nr:hypothetical protein BJ508DRAFT_90447 [Ascobolus immersus RN42]